MNTRHLLIIFHSQSARAEAMALAAYKGANLESQVTTTLCRAVDADSTHLIKADGLLVVTPENFGAAAGGIKDFFDRSYYPYERNGGAGLRYALIIAAGNDGSGCERQLERILAGMKATRVHPATVIHGVPEAVHLQQCSDVAQAMAAGLAMGIF